VKGSDQVSVARETHFKILRLKYDFWGFDESGVKMNSYSYDSKIRGHIRGLSLVVQDIVRANRSTRSGSANVQEKKEGKTWKTRKGLHKRYLLTCRRDPIVTIFGLGSPPH
jgi:hypothetical protein